MISCVFKPEAASAYSVATSLAGLGRMCKISDEVCTMFTISADKDLLVQIHEGYAQDRWIRDHLEKAKHGMLGIVLKDGLWYVGNRLVIPRTGDLRETLF